MQEILVRFLGQEDSLEKEIATHCSILAWEITWTEEPARLQSMGSQRVSHDLAQQQQYNECMRSEPPGGPWLSNFFISYFIICVSLSVLKDCMEHFFNWLNKLEIFYSFLNYD